jgi:hypothetical protein
LGSVHCQSSNESLNDQSCNKRNISELNDEIECNDQSENDIDRIDAKDCCVDFLETFDEFAVLLVDGRLSSTRTSPFSYDDSVVLSLSVSTTAG